MERPLGLRAPVAIGRDLDFPNAVGLFAGIHPWALGHWPKANVSGSAHWPRACG
jgi:hypothetical protein